MWHTCPLPQNLNVNIRPEELAFFSCSYHFVLSRAFSVLPPTLTTFTHLHSSIFYFLEKKKENQPFLPSNEGKRKKKNTILVDSIFIALTPVWSLYLSPPPPPGGGREIKSFNFLFQRALTVYNSLSRTHPIYPLLHLPSPSHFQSPLQSFSPWVFRFFIHTDGGLDGYSPRPRTPEDSLHSYSLQLSTHPHPHPRTRPTIPIPPHHPSLHNYISRTDFYREMIVPEQVERERGGNLTGRGGEGGEKKGGGRMRG